MARPTSACREQAGINTQFKCERCSRLFSTKGNLSRHVQATHVGGHTFPCPICGKEFKRKEDRTTHIRVHTGERAVRRGETPLTRAYDRCTCIIAAVVLVEFTFSASQKLYWSEYSTHSCYSATRIILVAAQQSAGRGCCSYFSAVPVATYQERSVPRTPLAVRVCVRSGRYERKFTPRHRYRRRVVTILVALLYVRGCQAKGTPGLPVYDYYYIHVPSI